MKNASKIVALGTAAVTGVALVGVGFAAWVIGGQTAASAGGNIYVDTVVNGINLSASVDEGSAIIYGRPEVDMGIENPWLNNDGATEKLNLNLTVTYTGEISSLNIKLDLKNDGSNVTALYNECIQCGIISDYDIEFMKDADFSNSYEPEGEPLDIENVGVGEYNITNIPQVEEEGTLYIQLQFRWGTLFAYTNPLLFFKDFEPDDVLVKSEDGILIEGSGEGAKTAKEWAEEALTTLNNTLADSTGGSSTSFVITLNAE